MKPSQGSSFATPLIARSISAARRIARSIDVRLMRRKPATAEVSA